jgi:NAD(P)-dependent dehydrogenase (short-subunit alcohol dehydrogenase family)
MSEQQRVAVVTGASSGVGLAAAKALAAQGFRVIAVGRDAGRSAAAEAEIRTASSTGAVTVLRADLALMRDAAELAGQIAALTDRVDVLINNAGGMVKDKVITAEGLESCFAGNHLGPFLLTLRLLPLLRHAAADAGEARIINTSSDGSEMIPGLNMADVQNLDNYTVGAAYCSGKLANVMFARALAQRFGSEGISAFSVHPGTVASNFVEHVPDSTRKYMETLEAITPVQGADTLVWLATAGAGELSNGGYYYLRALRTPNPQVDDAAAVDWLWNESERLVAGALSA